MKGGERKTGQLTTTKICTRGRSTRDHSQGFVTDPHACLLARASFLPWRRGMGSTLERHPFSGLIHSAGELFVVGEPLAGPAPTISSPGT